ncbi:LysR family transcriptional activator of dmlA [Paraburkholderia sp. GAS199]|uniref:LysR family transcriptional regulator n=1 Tax=Paraburkholderia sp. GAS199 TaxID=3035126 RepID=UPI003D24C72C
MDYLETVRTFLKVAEAKGFTRAADFLGTTTPVVTRQIAALEKHLGARLFRRSTRHITLTESGQIFLSRASIFVREIEEAENLVSIEQGEPSGTLRIALPVAFGLCHLSSILTKFSAEYPGVSLQVILSDEPIKLVEQGFDVAIVPEDEASSLTIIKRRFGSSSMKLVASPEYLSRHSQPKSLDELGEHVLLLEPEKWADELKRVADHPGKEVIPRKKEIIVNNLHMIRRLAIDGHGIAALPEFLIGADIEAGCLINVISDAKMPVVHMCLAFETRQNMPLKMRAFIDFIVGHYRLYGLEISAERHPSPALRGNARSYLKMVHSLGK